MDTITLILTIWLSTINIGLALFAILYPIKISNRDLKEIKDTQMQISSIVSSMSVQTQQTQEDVREIIRSVLDKTIDKSPIKDEEKEKLRESLSKVLAEKKEMEKEYMMRLREMPTVYRQEMEEYEMKINELRNENLALSRRLDQIKRGRSREQNSL